jgi:hypothetical protein
MASLFTQNQIEAIAGALGDTGDGLTGSEIGYVLNVCGMSDPTPQATKRHRLHNAFVTSQNARADRGAILAFIRHSTKPERHLRNPGRFEPLRANLNRALAFCGMAVDACGKLGSADAVSTIAEAERRAQDLRQDLVRRGVHDDMLRFCRSELLADELFSRRPRGCQEHRR